MKKDNRNLRFNFRPTSVRHYENGVGFCRLCGEKAKTPKGRYCSSECSDETFIRLNPNYARICVYKRDKGICSICKIDTNKISRKSYRGGALHTWEADHIIPVIEGGAGCGLDGLRTLCLSCHNKESGTLRKRLNKKKTVPIQLKLF